MKLKDLIRGKRADNGIATATHATVATNEGEEDGTVANVATVSVANPWRNETEELKEDNRQRLIEEMLSNNQTRKYAVLVDDAESDPVVVTVGIQGIATFQLHIPQAHYDGIALLEVIEQHSTDLKLSSEANPSTIVNKRNQEAHSKPQRRAA